MRMERVNQITMHAHLIRPQLEFTPVRSHGFVQLTPVIQRVAEIAMNPRIVGPEFQRPTIRESRRSHRSRSASPKRVPQVDVESLRQIRPEFDHPAVRGHGLVELAPGPVRVAQVELRFRQIRLKLECPAMRRPGLPHCRPCPASALAKICNARSDRWD